jgi:hypothetical protein
VPAHHVRRRFLENTLVDVYMGPRVGWNMGMVHAREADMKASSSLSSNSGWRGNLESEKRRCPAGHELNPEAVTRDTQLAVCDSCGKENTTGVMMYGCRTCNYDMCGDCYFAKASYFAGTWNKGTISIDCTTLTGRNGDVYPITVSGDKIEMTQKGCSFEGRLLRGEIQWNDGDIWVRVQEERADMGMASDTADEEVSAFFMPVAVRLAPKAGVDVYLTPLEVPMYTVRRKIQDL